MRYAIVSESGSENCKNLSTFAEVMGKHQSGCFFLNTVYFKAVHLAVLGGLLRAGICAPPNFKTVSASKAGGSLASPRPTCEQVRGSEL